MGYNMANILVNLKKEITEEGGGGSSDLGPRVTALEETVGDLEKTVGDASSGLVKSVADIEAEIEEISSNDYSTTEVKIGTWEGEDLFRKIVSLGALPNATTKSFTIGVTTETVKRIEVYYSNNSGYGPLPNNDVGVEFNKSTKKLDISSSSDYSSYTGSCILEYTKPSANKKGVKNNG